MLLSRHIWKHKVARTAIPRDSDGLPVMRVEGADFARGAEYRLASLFRQVSVQPALPKVRIVFTESPGLSVQFFGPRPRETLVKMIKVLRT